MASKENGVKMASKDDDKSSDIPESLYDATNNKTYTRMRFLGKGGYAKCYEIKDVVTNDAFAGKIISKKLLMKVDENEKVTQEIAIHRDLNHPNIVKYLGFFEDSLNIYIVLELCKHRSMLELYRRRRTITEYECRYFMRQIIQGVKYLHESGIIHRDLKLANLFLDDMLHVKIGDFGLATRLEYKGERKISSCGTPNYIAPEILTQKGHAFEVDVWSIGCLMYTLLVGQPPFRTKSVRDTYLKIVQCEYSVPSDFPKSAAEMVKSILQIDAEKRPTIGELLHFDFLSSSDIPMFLPSSCLSVAPRLELNEKNETIVKH